MKFERYRFFLDAFDITKSYSKFLFIGNLRLKWKRKFCSAVHRLLFSPEVANASLRKIWTKIWNREYEFYYLVMKISKAIKFLTLTLIFPFSQLFACNLASVTMVLENSGFLTSDFFI